MATIKIEDLPVLEDLDAKWSKGIFGGYSLYNFDTSYKFDSIDSYSTTTYIDPAFEPDSFFIKID